jgi:hypothetical protein
LHVSVADLARETAEAAASGIIERVIREETPEQAAFRTEALGMVDALRRRVDDLQTALDNQPAPIPAEPIAPPVVAPHVTADDMERLAVVVNERVAEAVGTLRQETAASLASMHDRMAQTEAKLAALLDAIQTVGAK